jgi:hypothetical protein
LASEIIVYDPDENYDYPRIKIGDGKSNINSLPFVTKEYAKISDIPTKPEDIGALPDSTVIPTVPTKISAFENDKGYLTQHQSLDDYAKTADLGALATKDSLTASDVGALPNTYTPPNQTAEQVGADPKGTAATAVSQHNTADDSHNDIRLELKAINDKLTAFFDSDNQTLDELSEIVAYITSNKALIDSITTSKVSVADIINNLATNVANKPLSAAQGVVLKGLIDAVSASLSDYQPKGDYALASAIPTKVSQLTNDSSFASEDYVDNKVSSIDIPSGYVVQPEPPEDKTVLWVDMDDESLDDFSEAINAALAQAKASGEFDGKDGASVTVKSVSESTADGGSNVVEFTDGKTLTVKNGKTGGKGDPGKTPVKGLDYWTPVDQQEIESFIASELAKRGQLAPEYVDSVEKCTDTSKMYVLPDGYIYAYMYGESEAATYKNILDGTELHLNERINSSGSYVGLDGYVSTDYLKMKPGDVVRVNLPLSNLTTTHDKNRGIAYNASKTIAYGNDGWIGYYAPITEENGVCSFVFGQVYNTPGNTSSGTKMIATISDEGYMRFNFWIKDTEIKEADVADLAVTLNEPISAGTVAGYDWRNTGLPFVPADYEDRIQELEEKVSQMGTSAVKENISASAVFAPSPQLPADDSTEADFNAEDMTTQDIYDYFDALCEKYPNYITKETLGKDASNTLDVNRYVLCRHYYKAWQRVNYPKMYAWVNGSTIIYSKSVSPRIGDTLYSTAYIGTSKGTVSAVSNANQTRTVGGVVYTRDKTKDVEPTLVFTSIISNAKGSTVYNQNQTSATTVSAITATTMTGANGISYTRYPMGDRDRTMERSTVVTIGANEHGFTPDPREPAIVCARLAKDLCECRNADNLFLNQLKNGVMLIIVPVINPYGFNLGTAAGYYNKNGVNINRNYDCPGWGNLDDTGTGAQGAYGGSEIETQYFMNTISEPNSAVAVSVHALGYSTNGGNALTHYQGNNFNSSKIADIAEVMAANYNLQFTDYGTTPPDTNQGGKSPAYITWAGAVGGLIEMQAEGASTERNTAYILEADYTLLLQCIHMWLSDYMEQ